LPYRYRVIGNALIGVTEVDV